MGRKKLADWVYRRRMRREVRWDGLPARVWRWLWFFLSGYGTRPDFVAGWCILVIVAFSVGSNLHAPWASFGDSLEYFAPFQASRIGPYGNGLGHGGAAAGMVSRAGARCELARHLAAANEGPAGARKRVRVKACSLRYDIILFDFDYTLVDASVCLFSALRAGLSAAGVTAPGDDTLRPLIGIPLERQFTVLAPGKHHAFGAFRSLYAQTRDSLEAVGTTLIPGAEATLRALKAAGGTMEIVSTGSPARIARALARYGLQSYFDDLAGGAPDKGVILTGCAARYGRERCVYVGDRPDDAQAARRAKIAFIGVCTGAFGPADFSAGETVVSSIAELPHALATGG